MNTQFLKLIFFYLVSYLVRVLRAQINKTLVINVLLYNNFISMLSLSIWDGTNNHSLYSLTHVEEERT